MTPELSIIIPTLNEAHSLEDLLGELGAQREVSFEVILADGGSGDDTLALGERAAQKLGVVLRSIQIGAGRARQMNAGARSARGSELLFLHADTILPSGAVDDISNALEEKSWGRFDVSLSGDAVIFRVIETMMNLRSRLTSSRHSMPGSGRSSSTSTKPPCSAISTRTCATTGATLSKSRAPNST